MITGNSIRILVLTLFLGVLSACGGGGGGDGDPVDTGDGSTVVDTDTGGSNGNGDSGSGGSGSDGFGPDYCPNASDCDEDGVPNNGDLCPNTGPGVAVASNGCAVDDDDDDNDGVPDVNDDCPNSTISDRVDDRGCPIAGGGGSSANGDMVPEAIEGLFIGTATFSDPDVGQQVRKGLGALVGDELIVYYEERCDPNGEFTDCKDNANVLFGTVVSSVADDEGVTDIELSDEYMRSWLVGRPAAEITAIRDQADVDGNGISDELIVDFEVPSFERVGVFRGAKLAATGLDSTQESLAGFYSTNGASGGNGVGIDSLGKIYMDFGAFCDYEGVIKLWRQGLNFFKGSYTASNCASLQSNGEYEAYVLPLFTESSKSILYMDVGDNGRSRAISLIEYDGAE